MATKKPARHGGGRAGHAENPGQDLGALLSVAGRADRIPRCRMLDAYSNRCSGESAEVDAEIALCVHHLAAAWVMVQRRTDLVLARWTA